MSLEKIFGVLPGPDLERDRRPRHKRGLVPEGPLSCPAFQAREQQAQVSVDTWRQARREGADSVPSVYLCLLHKLTHWQLVFELSEALTSSFWTMRFTHK